MREGSAAPAPPDMILTNDGGRADERHTIACARAVRRGGAGSADRTRSRSRAVRSANAGSHAAPYIRGERCGHLSAAADGGGQAVALVRALLVVVRGVVLGREAVERRLARVTGHEGAKASVRYPYILAQTVNCGRRQWSAVDFGLPYQPQPPYDFVQGMKTSKELLKALEAGDDPLFRAKGDRERHYWFEEAREMMAYRLYAPLKWDGKSKLPMVLVLHGNTRDQNYYFDRDDHILSKLAEQYGYLVVCPMGYRPSAGWGSSLLARRTSGAAADPARTRQAELSERDALHVLELVTREYPVDSSRIYLFGHSAGGAGAWYIGQKYAGRFAAIAASAAPTRPDGFPFDRLKAVPVMVCHGDKDDEVPVASSRNMVKAAKENGLDPQYLEVPGATHGTIVALVEPKVFEFFDRHRQEGATSPAGAKKPRAKIDPARIPCRRKPERRPPRPRLSDFGIRFVW
jgi:predicted esterase